MTPLTAEIPVAFGIRIVVGIVFLAAGLAKARNLKHFVQTAIVFTGLFPSKTRYVAQFLPALETTLGTLLVLGLLTKPTLIVTEALLMAFTAGVAINLVKGRQIECGCFGELQSELLNNKTLMRDVLLIVVCGIAFVTENYTWTLDRFLSEGSRPVQLFPWNYSLWLAACLAIVVTLAMTHLFSLVSDWDQNIAIHVK